AAARAREGRVGTVPGAGAALAVRAAEIGGVEHAAVGAADALAFQVALAGRRRVAVVVDVAGVAALDLSVGPQRELDLAERRDTVLRRLLGLVRAAVVRLAIAVDVTAGRQGVAVAAGRHAVAAPEDLAARRRLAAVEEPPAVAVRGAAAVVEVAR